jgi:hypothetical protein
MVIYARACVLQRKPAIRMPVFRQAPASMVPVKKLQEFSTLGFTFFANK